MNQNKICPECGAEYLPHIEKCADCGVIVLSAEECMKAQEQRKRTEETLVDSSVKVMEGDLSWMSELRTVLLNAGIPCKLHSEVACRKGCCGDTLQLKVSPEDLERSRQAIEEYLMELDPDLKMVKEMLGQGKCPACGSAIGCDARECPDCGLPLIIVEEED
ncbi:MAG: hypothetical protein HZA15_16840 [Nitrospirae bacterium]|nr:hypothetical protein [Nitrospirota bacterium]